MSKAWGGVGAWAADAEEAEKEAKESKETKEVGKFVVGASRQVDAFPSLGEGVAAAKAPKKKKGQTVSLSEFTLGGAFAPPGSRQRAAPDAEKLTLAEMAMLPTGPRERDEEAPGGLGGGFRDYGGRYGDRDDRGRGDRYGDERGQREDEGPSRADGDSNWGASKKALPPGGRDRGYGGFDRDDDRRSGDRDLLSKADEVDNWGSTKKFVPSDRRGGFDDGPRRSGDSMSRADDDANWGSSKRFTASAAPPSRGYDLGRRELGGDGDRWARREVREDIRPTDVRPPGERPRLNLQKRTLPVDAPPPPSSVSSASGSSQDGDGSAMMKANPVGIAQEEKGQDWRKPDLESESKPSSRGSSRPQTPDTEALPVKPKPKVNPFGDAKPREVLLEEKGLDWRKIDVELEHKAVIKSEPV
eukprot:TRINITY_DN22235_c0_g1_i1.p1 TRINITY_DN22235_c0_g1~~TRINITY_DN22235_c0_g1_i1.p1  ORF type:complete len:415 (+),score=102.42 TRINITY_DN22235_c0_g1_i1:69-1313(+)